MGVSPLAMMSMHEQYPWMKEKKSVRKGQIAGRSCAHWHDGTAARQQVGHADFHDSMQSGQIADGSGRRKTQVILQQAWMTTGRTMELSKEKSVIIHLKIRP
jgi:hypothetical protein